MLSTQYTLYNLTHVKKDRLCERFHLYSSCSKLLYLLRRSIYSSWDGVHNIVCKKAYVIRDNKKFETINTFFTSSKQRFKKKEAQTQILQLYLVLEIKVVLRKENVCIAHLILTSMILRKTSNKCQK